MNGGEVKQRGTLETAGAVVGLLAGVAALVYVLGGAVIALRLLFDHYTLDTVRVALGQLPRELVITTAMLTVIGPAALVGLGSALVHGARGRPRARNSASDDLTDGTNAWRFFAYIGVIALMFAMPTLWQTLGSDWISPLLIVPVFVFAIGYGVVAAGWYLGRRVGRKPWSRLVKAIAAGGIWAVYALIPSAMAVSVVSFEEAQVCTSASALPERGLLIGEGGGRLLLGQQSSDEAGVLSLPADQVTKTEYGDFSSTFTCPDPSGQGDAPPPADLGGHGSDEEQRLAMELRPYIFFDSGERWRPIEVGSFADESFVNGGTHETCRRAPDRCEPFSLEQLTPTAKAPVYIDIHGSGEDGAEFASPERRCRSERPPAVDCNEGPPAVIYYQRTSHEGRWYWDYWWFLRYSEYTGPLRNCNKVICSNHEGDWEGMTVITTTSLEPKVIGAIYAAHSNRVLADGASIPLAEGHLMVFVARGTHAGYPFRCDRGCKQYEKKGGIPLPEDPHDGAVAWGGNSDSSCSEHSCVQPLPEVGEASDDALPRAGKWAGWRGLWGRTCSAGCDSPLLQGSPRSPGLQKRFLCPWVLTDRARPGTDGSGLSSSKPVGDSERLLNACAAQRGGL